VLAWTLGRRRDTRLTRQVLNAAVRRRQPPPGLVFHGDRGSEYVGAGLRDRLRALGIHQSSARRGPEDNAHMESYFHSLKAELVHGATFAGDAQLRQAIRHYVHYYNHRRLHSALAYRSPVDDEAVAASRRTLEHPRGRGAGGRHAAATVDPLGGGMGTSFRLGSRTHETLTPGGLS
jgi:transposase InsO family protein